MKIRRFIMEDWLAAWKDSCPYNLGESGIPDLTVGELFARAGVGADDLTNIRLADQDTRGTERLREAIVATYAPPVTFNHLTVTTGTSEALAILFMLLTEHRRRVVAPGVAFQALTEVPRALGAEVVTYPLGYETGFLPDPDDIIALIDDSVGVVVLNTPHNPSGVAIPAETVDAVAHAAARHGATVLVDEHYRYLPLKGESPSRSFACPDENIVATGSLTKCFGVIGLRVGWIVASPALIAEIRDTRDYLTHTLSPVSDHLAALALEHRDAFILPALARLRENAAMLARMVALTPGLSLVPPDGGAVAFPRYAWNIPTDMFCRGLIEQHGVFVLPGSAFECEHHFRINIAQPQDSFREALNRLADYCAGLGPLPEYP